MGILPDLDMADPGQHVPPAPEVDAADGEDPAFSFSRLLMPDLLKGLNRRRRAKGSNGPFVPPPPHRRPVPPPSRAMEMDAGLRESLGFSKPILSGKAVKTIKSEYLSRAFALDLKSITRDSSNRRADTERARPRHSGRPREQLAELPAWQAAPQFEGLLSVIPPLTARGRLENESKRTGHSARRGGSKGSRTTLESITTPWQSRGVVGEREHALEMPSSETIASLRQEMGLHGTFSEQVSAPGMCLPTQARVGTQHSFALYDTSKFDRSSVSGDSYGGTSIGAMTRRRDSLLAPLSSVVPKVFKGGRSFPLGRGGTDHRQMLGIPSTANNPAVVAAREALRLRFRTTVEAFAFHANIAGEDSSGNAGLSWMQPLSIEVIEKGFNLLRIRVDVSQLMLQIADKDHRLTTGTSFMSFMTRPLSSSNPSKGGTSVSFESWNQQLAWHPPLLQPGRTLTESMEGITDICATALRATAALSAVKATTWRAPSSQKEIQETLSFLHESRELFQVFATAPESLRTQDARMRSPPLSELRLSFRDLEALFRQVHVLPGWITSQGLSMIYGEMVLEERVRIRAEGQREDVHSGITFEQYQRCVRLIAKRLRLKLVMDGKEIAPDFPVSFDEHFRGLQGSKQSVKKRRMTSEIPVVRAFARIHRVTNDHRTFRRFCSRFSGSGGDESSALADEQADAGEETNVAEAARGRTEEDRMDLSGFVELMRTLGLLAASKQVESSPKPGELKTLSFRRAKDIFEMVAGARDGGDINGRRVGEASLSLDDFLATMHLVAAELDESAAPYLLESPQTPTGYPPYNGHTLLGNMLSMYRDNHSLVSELTLKEALVLIEVLQYAKLQAGQSFCTQGALTSRAAIVLSGSLKQVDTDSKADPGTFLMRGSWCAPDVPLMGRTTYTSSITAESEVELAVVSIEAFEAFCDRIRSMHVKGHTRDDADAVKERLLARLTIGSTAAAQGQNMLASVWHSESPNTSPNDKSADLVQYMRKNLDTLDDEELYRESVASFKEERRDAGEEVQGNERPKTALVKSDYAEQLHALGCYYFNLKQISAARRLLCEACRIRIEIFGPKDGRTLSSVRVLEQVDKWAYRQVDDSIRVKVLERCAKSVVQRANAVPQSQHQIEADMREFLRSRGGNAPSRAGGRAEDMEVSKLGLKFLLVTKEEEVPMPRELVQKYSNLRSNRKEWLDSMQSNVKLLLDERAKWEEMRNAPRLTGERALSRALKDVNIFTTTQWQCRSLYEGMHKALSQQEIRGLHMGVEAIVSRMTNYAAHVVASEHDGPAPVANAWDSWGGMAAARTQQAECIFHLRLARKMVTATTIVDLQAQQLRKTMGIPWKDAYKATASAQEMACLVLQTNIRCHFAKSKMFIVKCANCIRMNYRVHQARKHLKQQRVAKHDTWQTRRKTVKGKGSVEEWNDRHRVVQRTMTKAIEVYDRLHSGGSDHGQESEEQAVHGPGDNRNETGNLADALTGVRDTSLSESTTPGERESIMYGQMQSEDPSEYSDDTEEEDENDYQGED